MRYSLQSEEHGDVEILLFTQVSNAENIRSQLLAGGVQAAILNASLVPDIFLVLVATSNAVRKRECFTTYLQSNTEHLTILMLCEMITEREKSMSTRNVFTEIVYNLSSTRNISKALQTFGIDPDTKSLLAVIPEATDELTASVKKAIQGTERDAIPETLHEISDLPLIEKVHGITENEKKCGSLVDAIVTRMACRDVK